jgi:ribosome biogenesis protein ENP2
VSITGTRVLIATLLVPLSHTELRPRNFSWVDKEEYVQRQAQTRSKPRLVAGDLDAEGASRSSSRSATFGQRLRQGDEDAARSDLSRGKRRDDGILTARRTKDGGMEMSFVPKAGGGRGEDDLNVDYVPQTKQDATAASDGKKRPTDKRVERFAAGLEKGGYRGAADGQREMSEDERKGRTGRRHPGRSASKNVFRGL